MNPGGGDYPDQIEELLRAAQYLTDSNSRIELYQEAIRLADTHADLDLGFRLRRQLIELASQALKYDLYGVTFAWCFAQARRHPDRYPPTDLLYHYQHVIGKLVNFPEFPRDQYEALVADVLKHLGEYGYSPRTVLLERRSVAIDFGDPAMGATADAEWRKHPRDALSSGTGFEAGRQMEYDHFRRDDEASVATYRRWYADSGRQSWCDDWIDGEAILPLFRIGQVEEAIRCHQRSWREIRPREGYQWFWGPHLSFLGLTGNLDRGVRLFQVMLASAFDQTDPLSRFHFLEHALVLFRQLAASRPRPLRLRIPPSVSLHDAGRLYDPAAVLAWIEVEATDIARQFDARNGNTYHTELLACRRDMDRLACPHPLPK